MHRGGDLSATRSNRQSDLDGLTDKACLTDDARRSLLINRPNMRQSLDGESI